MTFANPQMMAKPDSRRLPPRPLGLVAMALGAVVLEALSFSLVRSPGALLIACASLVNCAIAAGLFEIFRSRGPQRD